MMYLGFALLLVVVGVLAYVLLGDNKKDERSIAEPVTKEKTYNDLRMLALNTDYKALGIQMPFDAEESYGIVMDWYVGNGVATLVCLATGDTSLYFSGGASMLGGIGVPAIREMSKNYVARGKEVLHMCKPTREFPLPEAQTVKFYILTNKGKYAGTESMANFQNGHSLWFPLFIDANNIMSEMRKIDEQRNARK